MDRDAQFYLEHIAGYEREFKTWEGRVDKIVKRYRDEKRDKSANSQAKFNVLWSNVQTLKSATFARMPLPDVSRRFKDNDPIGRVASLILERALDFEVQHFRDFGASLRQCVYDRFLGGRGTAWVRYEPHFKTIPGEQVTEDVEAESFEELDYECAPVDYVHWRDFGHAVTRTWEECPIVWRKVYMTRMGLVERFGDEGEAVPLDALPQETQKTRQNSDSNSVQMRGLIYEIWDKETKEALWLCKSTSKILDRKPDPLGLEDFFPCPPPIYATLTTDTLVPLPDFTLYQDQANELDILADRIDGLIKALQVKGTYDSAIPELARLFTEAGNGDLIPVKNFAAFAEKQGLKGAVDIVDLTPIAAALREAYMAFEQVKGQIYELTGISDILRGETQASETATAQKIKNSYASMRLKTYQDEVERFAARLLQIKAQIICRHYSPETILKISAAEQLSDADKQLIGPAMQMLQDNIMRTFRIEVSTDSMVYQDEVQEKQDRMEFLQAVSGFVTQLVEASQSAPELMPVGVDLLKFGVQAFRVGKNVEGTIDQAADQMKQRVVQEAANPKPDPEAQKAQATQQAAQVKAQSDQQLAQVQEQAETQRQAMAQQHEAQLAAMQAQAEAQEAERQRQHEAQLEAMRAQSAEQMAQLNQTMQLILQRMKGETAIEVAEIGAETTLDAAQISAAKQSETE